jgi:hypothetical protein
LTNGLQTTDGRSVFMVHWTSVLGRFSWTPYQTNSEWGIKFHFDYIKEMLDPVHNIHTDAQENY